MKKRNTECELPEIVCKFRDHIAKRDYDFRSDRVSSVMDYLYVTYTEYKGCDSEAINRGFKALDDYMEGISLDDNNAIFCLVCNLCDLYEERAFKDGLQLGAYLILECQGK